ncbi:MAG: FecR family protein [Spirosomataceae bacterium]
MTQQEFNDLSKRYLEGKTTKEEDQLLVEWHQLLSIPEPTGLSDSQKSSIEKHIWKQIHKQIEPVRPLRLIRLAWGVGIAACVMIGLLWAGVFRSATSATKAVSSLSEKEKLGLEIKNTTQSEQEVRLEDGTVVTLKQNSSIVYDKTYNQAKREVYLKGEAFFKVKRDVTRPFVVHTGELITEVLGTSFRIKHLLKANTIEVAVTTGKVSVYSEKTNRHDERNGVILTPNQRVIFDIVSKNIVPTIVENPIPIPPVGTSQPNLIFQTASLQTVLNSLSQLYGIEFVIANPKIKDCHITADLSGLSMFTQLELICKAIDATYEKRGTVVFINGEGC